MNDRTVNGNNLVISFYYILYCIYICIYIYIYIYIYGYGYIWI